MRARPRHDDRRSRRANGQAKHRASALALLLLLFIVGLAQAREASAQPRVANPLPGATEELTRWPSIAPLDPRERELLAPLIARGAALVIREIESVSDARVTMYTQVRAPLAIVRAVVASPERYTEVIPALSRVEVLFRQANRAAFRVEATAAIFVVSANATMHVVSDRRVDIEITQSDVGIAGTRWELFPDSSGQDRVTTVALSMWCDPTRANWLVRQFVNNSGYASSSADIAAVTILGLGARRRAEQLAGSSLPIRPARSAVPLDGRALVPPPAGPWLSLLHRTNVIALTLDEQGSLVQATGAQATWTPPAELLRRAVTADMWNRVFPWIRGSGSLRPGARQGRYGVEVLGPLAPGRGEFVVSLGDDGRSVTLDGVSGVLENERHRWDLYPSVDASPATYVLYTGTSDSEHAGWFPRLMLERDVWSDAAVTGYWNTLMARYLGRSL